MQQQETATPHPATSDKMKDKGKSDGARAVRGAGVQHEKGGEAPRLAAGDWLRAVMGFQAPFGRDGLPTVWG